jgi:glucose/arabinose dehydrogenase
MERSRIARPSRREGRVVSQARWGLALVALGGLLSAARPAAAQNQQLGVRPVVTSGLTNPLYVTAAPGDPNNIYIVQQGPAPSQTDPTTAQIKVFNLQTGALSDFATISGISTIGNEQGLLGLAFHPDYQTNGRFFVNVTAPGGAYPSVRTNPSQQLGNGVTQIREYRRSTANPNVADPNFFRLLMSFDQPQRNHNGGWLGFSPRPGDAGNLYLAFGDGGGADDDDEGHNPTIGNGQDRTVLLGKMLRINVDRDDFADDATRNYGIPANNPYATATDGSRPEIFLTGLRNPFRASFDRATGDLFIGDVGQNTREELDLQRASNPGGGENYGWRYREGLIPEPRHGSDPLPPGPPVFTDPVFDYVRPPPPGQQPSSDFFGATIIGGYVYNGTLFPELVGRYIFADFISGRLYSMSRDAQGQMTFVYHPEVNLAAAVGGLPFGGITSFGEDLNGEIYLVGRNGTVYQLVPEPSAALALLIVGAGTALRRRRSSSRP